MEFLCSNIFLTGYISGNNTFPKPLDEKEEEKYPEVEKKPEITIDDFDKDEVVEIVDIDYAIEDFINDKTKRTIRIKHRPNKQILLRLIMLYPRKYFLVLTEMENSIKSF